MEKNWSTVQLHCRECNARMMDYTLCQDDDRIVLQGITIKCNRCKRVMMLKNHCDWNAFYVFVFQTAVDKNSNLCFVISGNLFCDGLYFYYNAV